MHWTDSVFIWTLSWFSDAIVFFTDKTILPISTHFSVARSVCLSSVCHICAPGLKNFRHLDAVWQILFVGPMSSKMVSDPQVKRRFASRASSQIMQLHAANSHNNGAIFCNFRRLYDAGELHEVSVLTTSQHLKGLFVSFIRQPEGMGQSRL